MTTRLLDAPAAAIRLTPANPRTDGETDLAGLVASLAHGLAQRPTLVEVEPGVFEVLTGERRVRAGLALGWTAIPAVVEQPLDGLAAHSRRVSENLHRKDLGPLDEARALKLDWLNANVLALDLAGEAAAALAQAGSVRAGLAAVAAVLEAAEWSPSRPAVTQEAYLESRGLGISKAAMRKKLQLLNLSDAAQERIDALGLTEAGIRAFMRLDIDQQDALLAALDADPTLARKVKTIIQDVTKRGYVLSHALALARGEVWTGMADDEKEDQEASGPQNHPEADRGDLRAPALSTKELAAPQLTANDAAKAAALSKAALELLTRAEEVQTCAAQLAELLGGRAAADVPEHGELIQVACDLIRESIDPLIH